GLEPAQRLAALCCARASRAKGLFRGARELAALTVHCTVSKLAARTGAGLPPAACRSKEPRSYRRSAPGLWPFAVSREQLDFDKMARPIVTIMRRSERGRHGEF